MKKFLERYGYGDTCTDWQRVLDVQVDTLNRVFTIVFDGFLSCPFDDFVELPCELVIKDWETAYSVFDKNGNIPTPLSTDINFYELYGCNSINGDTLEIYTCNRHEEYFFLYFKNPSLTLRVKAENGTYEHSWSQAGGDYFSENAQEYGL